MYNGGLNKIIKENSDKLKYNRKGITSGLPESSWVDKYKTGGDISIPNVYPNEMVPRFNNGGGVGPYANFPSTGMLTRNVTGPKVPTMKHGGEPWTAKYKF